MDDLISKLNEKQYLAHKLIEGGKNLYIGGPGGMGKSFLLNTERVLTKDTSVFVAPTGISALNIGCSTAHSTFRIPPRLLTEKDYVASQKAEELFGHGGPVKRIFMDEGSMYRSDLFKATDRILRKIRRDNRPFGGIQVIVVGDFYQLCPVVNSSESSIFYDMYDSMYSFGTDSWSGANFEYVELTQPMRHSETQMIENLQNIRMKRPGWKDSLQFFNKIGKQNLDKVFEEGSIFLCTTNKAADTINESEYESLQGYEHTFHSNLKGKFDAEPAPKILKVKKGAKLLCVANNGELRNGMLVYFIGMTEDGSSMIVEDDEGNEYRTGKYAWKNIEYNVGKEKNLEVKEIGSYVQFPFKLGYAITVHKSQGCTLKSAIIQSSSGFFSHGQAYVALSRIKTLDGVAIMDGITEKDIIVDREVNEFYANNCRGIGLGF